MVRTHDCRTSKACLPLTFPGASWLFRCSGPPVRVWTRVAGPPCNTPPAPPRRTRLMEDHNGTFGTPWLQRTCRSLPSRPLDLDPNTPCTPLWLSVCPWHHAHRPCSAGTDLSHRPGTPGGPAKGDTSRMVTVRVDRCVNRTLAYLVAIPQRLFPVAKFDVGHCSVQVKGALMASRSPQPYTNHGNAKRCTCCVQASCTVPSGARC